MPDPNSFDLNNQNRSEDAVAQIPTSASEVDVRTMASDLDQMGRSGGMIGTAPAPKPAASTTPAPSSVAEDSNQENQTSVVAPEASSRQGLGKMIIITALIVFGALGLFALGYFVLGG